LAQFVEEEMEALGVTQVDLVAHSMGGLVARAWIAGLAQDELGDPVPYQGEIRRLVMAATPHYGADIASKSKYLAKLRKLSSDLSLDPPFDSCRNNQVRDAQASQMVFGSAFLKKLHEAWAQDATTLIPLRICYSLSGAAMQ
jgi:triacylglycerol esterase/lipase EstA (alpha/beta hydrolase family)